MYDLLVVRVAHVEVVSVCADGRGEAAGQLEEDVALGGEALRLDGRGQLLQHLPLVRVHAELPLRQRGLTRAHQLWRTTEGS